MKNAVQTIVHVGVVVATWVAATTALSFPIVAAYVQGNAALGA